MNSSSQPDIIRFPQTILNSCARERLEDSLRNAIIDRREAGQPLPLGLVRRVAWHPMLAAQLLRGGIFTKVETELLLSDPDSACSILLENYAGLSPLIEPRLLNHPPSTERLLRDQRLTSRPGLRSETEYLHLLADDADRRYRMTTVAERPVVLATLRETSEMRWSESPSMAYFYLATHDSVPVSAKIAKVLGADEEHQYLALRVACGRRRPDEEKTMLSEFREPAWAFHVLRDRLLPDSQENLEHVVHAHPAWLAEWWQIAHLERAQLEASYATASDRCVRHELLSEFYWFYRTTVARTAAEETAAFVER